MSPRGLAPFTQEFRGLLAACSRLRGFSDETRELARLVAELRDNRSSLRSPGGNSRAWAQVQPIRWLIHGIRSSPSVAVPFAGLRAMDLRAILCSLKSCLLSALDRGVVPG